MQEKQISKTKSRKRLENSFAAIESVNIKIPTWKDVDGFRVIGIMCPDSEWEDLKSFKSK